MHFAPLDSDVSWPSFNHAPTPGESVYDHWYSGGLRDVDAAELRDRDRGQHGWQLRSTTMIVSDKAGTPVAALCINSDVSPWLAARSLIDGMVVGGSRVVSDAPGLAAGDPIPQPADPRTAADLDVAYPATADARTKEIFPRSVDELVSHLIDDAIRQVDVPVELMKKSHKVAVVDELEKRGLFLLRDAVETIAVALGVSRFTIYNYLNELDSTGKRDE